MNLYQQRRDFVKTSRRWDLVKDGNLVTNQDAGANAFINEGIKLLYQMTGMPEEGTSCRVSLVAGDYSFSLPRFGSLTGLWVIDATGTKTQLLEGSIDNLHAEYGEEFSAVSQGQPTYYALLGGALVSGATLLPAPGGYDLVGALSGLTLTAGWVMSGVTLVHSVGITTAYQIITPVTTNDRLSLTINATTCSAAFDVKIGNGVDSTGTTLITISSPGTYNVTYVNTYTGTVYIKLVPTAIASITITELTLRKDPTRRYVLSLPPADSSYTVLAEGEFYPAEVWLDHDSCYWMEFNPRAVTLAACVIASQEKGQPQETLHWNNQLAFVLDAFDNDTVAQEMSYHTIDLEMP